eukprot:s2990_g22.t1
MCVKRIPHKVLTGDVSKPSSILSALKHRKIDVSKSLFLQVRPGLESESVPDASLSSASQLFARQALAEEKQVSSSTVAFGTLLSAMRPGAPPKLR